MNLAVTSDSLEIVEFRGDRAVVLARIEVDETAFPALKIVKLDANQRSTEPAPAVCLTHAVLSSRRGDHPTCYDLTVKGKADGLEIVLSGDTRSMAGDRHYRLFWWRAECRMSGGELVIHGPRLAGDIDS